MELLLRQLWGNLTPDQVYYSDFECKYSIPIFSQELIAIMDRMFKEKIRKIPYVHTKNFLEPVERTRVN